MNRDSLLTENTDDDCYSSSELDAIRGTKSAKAVATKEKGTSGILLIHQLI